MPIYLIFLWILLLLVAVLFMGVRLYSKRGRVDGEVVLGDTAVSDEGVAENVSASSVWLVEQVRWLVAVLFALGIMLVWMGQASYKEVPPPERWAVFAFMGLGLLCFLLAAKTAVAQTPPDWLLKITTKATTYLQINVGQLALILFAPLFSILAVIAAGELLLARHWLVSWLAFLASLIMIVVGFYALQGDGDAVEKVDIKKWDIIFPLFLFVAALLLRGMATTQFPNTFSGDEGSSGLHAAMFLDGRATNILTVGWFSFPALFYALQAGTIALFGQTIEALRLFSALGGALAVVATYFAGLIFFDRVTAVLAAIYLAASHYHIHMSRIGLNNIWDSFFGVVTFAALWHGWKTGKRSSFLICGFALGIGQYFYVSMRVVPLILLVWAGAAFIWKRPLFKQRLPGLIATATIAFVTVLPLVIFFGRNPDEFSAPLNRVSIWGPWLEQMMESTGKSATELIGWQMILAAQGFTHQPLQLLYNPGVPLLLSGAAALFLIGLLWAITHFDLRYLLLFLPILTTIISNGLSQKPPASQRFILVMPIVALFVALPLGQVVRVLRPLWPKFGKVVLAGTAVFILWISFLDINYYFTEVYPSGYKLGGVNTYTATEIASYLQGQEEEIQKVYFFGFPRMGYFSLSTIPYLVPEKLGEEVIDPLQTVPEWQLTMSTVFIFLPERAAELQFVQQAYPSGNVREFVDEVGNPLFSAYEVEIGD